jgi:cell wall-associated NlpC family hydrolase
MVGIRFNRAQTAVQRLRTRLVKARDELERARAGAFATPVQLVGSLNSSAIGTGLLAPFSFDGPTVAGAPGAALQHALAQLGTPYVWGAEGPYAFDCSGLTQAAYLSAGITLPRVAQQQYDAGPWVSAGEALQPGDLVFFGNGPDDVSHVGIVAGPGLMIDAPHSGAVVRFDSYERASYVGATRPAATLPVTAAPGEVLEFSTGAAETASPAAGEILFTKNP